VFPTLETVYDYLARAHLSADDAPYFLFLFSPQVVVLRRYYPLRSASTQLPRPLAYFTLKF
jgi:hypothetical protein